jgi:hypothetical protein
MHIPPCLTTKVARNWGRRIPRCLLVMGPPSRHRLSSMRPHISREKGCSRLVVLTVSSHLSACFLPSTRSFPLVCCPLCPRACLTTSVRMVSFPTCLIRDSLHLGLEKKGFLPLRGSRNGDWRRKVMCCAPRTMRWLCSCPSTSAGSRSPCTPSCGG